MTVPYQPASFGGVTTVCFRQELHERVAHLVMCRPEKRNSMIPELWRELPERLAALEGSGCRAVVLSSEGPHFTGGIDLSMFAGMAPTDDSREARLQRPLQFLELVKRLQDSLSSLEASRMPIVAAIQGGCIGGGVDLVTACDIRYATKDAFFVIEETNIGMTADVGTFPRLVKLIPEGVVRELAYTGRKMSAEEARSVGLVNAVFETQAEMIEHARGVAARIAEKAPIAIHGCKRAITHARDHSTQETLDFIGLWNASMLHAEEIMEAMQARAEKRPGDFVDLPSLTTPIDS